MTIKKCSKCGIEKDIELYSKSSSTKDSLQIWCKDCCREWRKINKKEISLKIKEWRNKNIAILKLKSKDRYQINKDRIISWHKEYRKKYPDRKRLADRKYYVENTERKKLLSILWQEKNKSDWGDYIGTSFLCQVCRAKIYFNRPKLKSPVCFDHRKEGNEPITGNPTDWLRKHPRTPENELLWDSCDFGKLCFSCNSLIPTKNRNQRAQGIVKYLLMKEFSKIGGPYGQMPGPRQREPNGF